ncbi:MAG TPA: dTMP kinase [Bacillota bacterium]|nr:dTMP kinase [Bacillota bacterium]
MKQGCFITLEGPDGGGKSTQARLLADYLEKQGREVVLTREPGGTPLAEEIRKLILTPTAEALEPMAEILLYTASRAQHVQGLIKPALTAGKVVICERFIDSSLAYQGYGLGWDLELIRTVNRIAVGEFMPDLTFLLDNDPQLGLERVAKRSGENQTTVDRIEARGVAFQQRVRQGFLELAADDSRIILIKTAKRTISEIHQEIITHLSGLN